MRQILPSSGLLILGLVLGCTSVAIDTGQKSEGRNGQRYTAWRFSVDIPKGVSVRRRDSQLDFISYWFYLSDNTLPILYAYAGNQPKFPEDVPQGSKKERISIGSLDAESIVWTDEKGMSYRQALVRLPSHIKVPGYVYFKYTELREDQKAVADGIIQTIKPE